MQFLSVMFVKLDIIYVMEDVLNLKMIFKLVVFITINYLISVNFVVFSII